MQVFKNVFKIKNVVLCFFICKSVLCSIVFCSHYKTYLCSIWRNLYGFGRSCTAFVRFFASTAFDAWSSDYETVQNRRQRNYYLSPWRLFLATLVGDIQIIQPYKLELPFRTRSIKVSELFLFRSVYVEFYIFKIKDVRKQSFCTNSTEF